MPLTKYAVLSYSTTNIGDDIQSVAAIDLLCKLTGITRSDIALINRERLSEYNGPPVILVANGWFSHAPAKFRPPPQVTPIFIGFHLHAYRILTDNIDYFKQHEPIGCRDLYTKEQFEKHGIKAYMSYCLTLTLDTRTDINQSAGPIYVVDGFASTPAQYKYGGPNIKMIRHDCVPNGTPTKQRFIKARSMLEMYKKSSKVVTSRLHAALPCIAMGVPIIFHHRKLMEDPRFKGYESILTTGKLPPGLKDQIIGYMKETLDAIGS